MGARPGVRERLSDLLLRVGADVAADAREVRRGIDARPAARGYETAVGAVAAARCWSRQSGARSDLRML